MIHGSFETAVSREKLMTPSTFNSDLFEKLGDLIAYKVIPRPHDEVAHVMTGMAKYFEPAEEE